MLDVRVLGGVEVRRDGVLVDLGGRQRRLLLAVLVARAGAATSVDVLADALWEGSPPASATAVLHAQLSRLRSAIEPDRGPRQRAGVLQKATGGYRLVLDDHQLDSARFLLLTAQARAAADRSDLDTAKQMYADALALWTGPVFGDLGDLPALATAARAFEEGRLAAGGDLMEVRLQLGEHHSIVGELEALVRDQPFHERFWGQLMLALYRSGRQADALGAYQRCRRTLISELGIEPGPQLQALDEAVLLQKSDLDWTPSLRPAVPAAAAQPSPPPRVRTQILGRHAELAEVRGRFRTQRLVTVTGPGGVGKTRLALETALALADEYPHGAAFCDLLGVASDDLVEAAVVDAVGASDRAHGSRDGLIEHLRARRLLLLIDNAERAAAEVAALVDVLLDACPQLTVLVTSREPLGVRGEAQLRLAPLDAAGPESPAVALFLDRSPHPPSRLETVEEICRRLDGLPLAIELAASMTASTPSEALAEGLDERLSVLVDTRLPRGTPHRTLRDVLAWSVETLPADQAALLRRLAVFANGFSAHAAGAVCEIAGPPAIAIAALVQRSLVQLHSAGTATRYRLLETIRADGLDRLADHGELDHYRSRHLAWCRGLAPPHADPRHGEDPETLTVLTPEIDNVVAALDWSLSGGDLRSGTELAVITAPWWAHSGRFTEGLRWLRIAAADAPDAATTAEARAGLAWLLVREGNLGDARAVLVDALDVVPADAPDLRDDITLHLALTEIDVGDLEAGAAHLGALPERPQVRVATLREFAHGRMALQAGHQHDAVDHFERCAQLARPSRMWLTLVRALGGLAQAESARANHQRAEGAIAEALAVCRRSGLLGTLPRLLGAAGVVAQRAGDTDLARTRFDEALSAARRIGDVAAEATTLANLGAHALQRGAHLQAVELLEEGVEAFVRTGEQRNALVAKAGLAEAVLGAHADVRRALQLCLDAVGQARELGTPWPAALALETAARALTMRRAPGDLGLAARLIGAAAATRAEHGRPPNVTENEILHRAIAEIERDLGIDAAHAEQDLGRTRGLQDVAAEFVATCSQDRQARVETLYGSTPPV